MFVWTMRQIWKFLPLI